MTPEAVNRVVFLNYNDKAEYLLDGYDIDTYLGMFMSKVEALILSQNQDIKPYEAYINRLTYLKDINPSELIDEDNNLSPRLKELACRLFNIFIETKTEAFKLILKKEYNIDYNNIVIHKDGDCEYTIINSNRVDVNNLEGFIFFSHFADIICTENTIHKLIDYIGYCAERG